MGIVVGGGQAVWRRERGDWFACGQYINDEPAIVVFPRNPSRLVGPNGLMQPCAAICLSVAFKYDDPKYLAMMAEKFATAMGKDTKDAKFALAELIHGSLLDLITMPPERTMRDEREVAEVTIKAAGKTYEKVVTE